jgi:hypothetical protein
MSRRWEENRTDGRLCLVIDPEDGTHPQRVYGKDKDEILEKVANTVEHGSRTIAALKAQPPRSAAPANNTLAPAPRKTMTPDERMRATADLSNPAKAPEAVEALLDERTNGEFSQFLLQRKRQAAIDHFAGVASSWASKHPEFPRSPANNKMLADSAALRVGLENVTEEILQTVYLELLDGGYLQSPAGQPDETPAPRPAREGTSYRRTSLRAGTPPPSNQLKYTRADVDKLSADKMLEKYNTDPDFRKAVDFYAQPRQTA